MTEIRFCAFFHCVVAAALLFVSQSEGEAAVIKKVIRVSAEQSNLLKPDAWRPWEQGFAREGELFVCDNGEDAAVQRGASQTVELNQTRPEPIVAAAWSKADNVGGAPSSDYSLYLDLVYMDGTPLWGQIASFSVGTHDWQRREVRVLPQKPVKSVAVHLLMRNHPGKAWFREPVLHQLSAPEGTAVFDGVPVERQARGPKAGTRDGEFQLRDVAADGDFVGFEDGAALGLRLESRTFERAGATFVEGSLADTTGKDRAVTLYYTVLTQGTGWRWLHDPRSEEACETGREYVNASQFPAGANGRLSRYPFAAIANQQTGRALALDMDRSAFFRVGYSGTGELYLAYDFGLTPEKPTADFRLATFDFAPEWGFRGALQRFYNVFPDYFRCRTPEQGLWMPFASISKVEGWEDFGLKFKEGNSETEWDDAHNITTFRYTEPMTWWMRMDTKLPRTMEAAVGEAKRLAAEGDKQAQALLASSYHNEEGEFPARLLDTPWCNGAVWSMNSMPGVAGEATDFKLKWNAELAEKLYGPSRKGDLDGEYVDSSEGYVTDVLDFRRDHFAGAQSPPTFALDSRKPVIFRGLIAYEYVRGIEKDIRARGKLMMANSTPISLCWLAPWLDVMGTETNWNHGGKWSPMSDSDLLYRRALCGPKPYCFLMNTNFDQFSHELVERYMQRSLAYGMFPGFFSADASTGHYFTRADLYNRDRPLFKKYVPLCKVVAEAGWQPVTNARSSDPKVYVERFGDKYLTVFNDSPEARTVTITLAKPGPKESKELVSGNAVTWQDGKATLELAGEELAVLELR
jgi:hypothetical protein